MSLRIQGAFNLAEVAEVIGDATYGRGVKYARDGRVRQFEWNRASRELRGTVAGKQTYHTFAHFVGDDAELAFQDGDCTCPMGYNCKHVAALVVAAFGDRPRSEAPKPTRQLQTWEQSLAALIPSGSAGLTHRADATPLAIELTLTEGGDRRTGPAVRLMARLVMPGRSGWVRGNLSWGKLLYPHNFGDHDPAHVQLLREIYGAYRSGRVDSAYNSYTYYNYNDDKAIDLSSFESRQLWPLLDEADAIGLQLVHGRKRLGPVAKYDSAEFCLDVTSDDVVGVLTVSPQVQLADRQLDAAPIGFIGSAGHGVVYIDRDEVRSVADYAEWHIGLAKLVAPVPPELRQMAVENRQLVIPATAHDQFRDSYYPRLRRAATIISSDESFQPPTVSPPTLVLRANYGDAHELKTAWEWMYQIGDSRRRAAFDTVGPEEHDYRDFDAERTILAGLDLPQPIAASSEFHGIDTMRFTTEMLPLLADQTGILVEMIGEVADYREAGDTLTIGVSTDEIKGESDWFELGVTITVEGREVVFGEVFLALASGQSHMLLDDGAYFSLDKPELRTLRDLIEESRALHDSRDGTLRISRFQVGLWDELTALGVVHRQANAWREQVAGLLSLESLEPTPVPAALDAQLRPYQADGFQWLAFLWKYRLGGILADDMGLGKTLQSLALICHARRDDSAGPPFLVVAPTSVVSNWATEAGRFAPGLSVVALSDTARRRGEPLADSIAGADVVVTSYTLFRLDFDHYAELPWSGLIMDEAQVTKNHQSKIYQCARKLPTSFKLAITGTPMENNLMELWSLLSITAPGLFPHPTRFRDYYALPIERQGNTELLGRLRRRMKPLVLRRTKEQVASDLPAKQEQVLEVELHPKHRKLYQTHLQRERQKVLGLIDNMNKHRFTILQSLTLLRQLSLHAGLVDQDHADLPSSKIDALVEQLRDVTDGGHRALVFSQFTRFLGQVRDRLITEGIEYCYLDGSTRKRADVLREFKNGSAPVFLISLKAGGFGLNLTEADYCFLLDPWWNPATEAQAIDRTHRIGQTRNVMVYRLIAKDTIEERVMALKARKAELFTNVMDEGDMFGSSLEAEDVRALFA